MKNPLMPFAAIMAGGIILVFVIAIYGATMGGGQSGEKAGGSEKAKQEEQGESASADPKKIFEGTCASCHGKNLQGKNGPSLKTIGSKLSKAEILDQIKNGGGGMPPNLLQGDKAKEEAVAEWLSKKK